MFTSFMDSLWSQSPSLQFTLRDHFWFYVTNQFLPISVSSYSVIVQA